MDRLQALLSAADEIMSEGGDVTVQAVVARAGQSLRTFYQHFAGKEDLMLALLEAGADELCAELERCCALETEPTDALRVCVGVLHRANQPQRSLRRMALVNFSSQLVHTNPVAYQQVHQRLVVLLEKLVAAARPSDPAPLRTAAVTLNLVQGTARRDALLVAQGLSPLSSEELWSAVYGLVFPTMTDAA